MAGRRAPLAEVPNAANSPFRGLAAAGTATKRARPQTADQRESTYAQPPPAKRQFVETEDSQARRNALMKRSSNAPPTALQRKLEAARESKSSHRPTERLRYNAENLESIRQWQNHYKKVFPTFVFYLDSIPLDMKNEIQMDIHTLGAVRNVIRSLLDGD